ncbi:hypothetical protein MKW92_002831 [Papaver armeniacum]|nr:hypothetical protein MKW92_002831 [Papaver armeniacum]
MEQIQSFRPYDKISDDGSWILVSDTRKKWSSNNTHLDASPSREWRTRYDTTSPEAELNPLKSENRHAGFSPPRQKRRHVWTPSPKGKVKLTEYGNKGPNLSPPRRRRRRVRMPSPEPDFSPSRKSRTDHLHPESIDLSPPRRTRSKSAVNSLVSALNHPRKKKSGLFSAREVERDMKDEISRDQINGFSRPLQKPTSITHIILVGFCRDDPQLDNMLKERIRWGIQWHTWKIDPIPNCYYGIKPGRHWDGVSRSNETEAQFFERMNVLCFPPY